MWETDDEDIEECQDVQGPPSRKRTLRSAIQSFVEPESKKKSGVEFEEFLNKAQERRTPQRRGNKKLNPKCTLYLVPEAIPDVIPTGESFTDRLSCCP
jgi:hypothetical protein